MDPNPKQNQAYKPPDPVPGKEPDMPTRLALERTGLAHERTLMGWVRTCFAIIGFGFTIFTFYFTMSSHEHLGHALRQPKLMCLALMAGGTVFMVLAVIQHYLSLRRLFHSGLDRRFSLPMFAAILVCCAGALGFWAILTEA